MNKEEGLIREDLKSIDPLKKIFLKVKYMIFHSTCSIWYEMNLDEEIYNKKLEMEIESQILVDDKSELINWLRDNKEKFPWIYFEKEIKCANENKHIYYILKYNKEIIAYAKLGIGKTYVHDFDRVLKLKETTVMGYDIFVHPSQSGKGLAVYATKDIAIYLKEKGFKKIIVHIEKWNVPSIKAATKSGLKPMNTICHLRIFNIPIYFKNGYIPFLDLEKAVDR